MHHPKLPLCIFRPITFIFLGVWIFCVLSSLTPLIVAFALVISPFMRLPFRPTLLHWYHNVGCFSTQFCWVFRFLLLFYFYCLLPHYFFFFCVCGHALSLIFGTKCTVKGKQKLRKFCWYIVSLLNMPKDEKKNWHMY